MIVDLVEGLTPGAEGLRFVILLFHTLSAITSQAALSAPMKTHLALEIDRGGAGQIAFVVGLLHGRRRRLSQIHVGEMCATCATMSSYGRERVCVVVVDKVVVVRGSLLQLRVFHGVSRSSRRSVTYFGRPATVRHQTTKGDDSYH